MRALVVDDCNLMQRQLTEALRSLGFKHVTTVEDGMGAISEIVGTEPDLILVDWNMPGIKGIDVVRRIRDRNVSTPMIMVTGESDKERIEEAAEAGVTGYIIKPFSTKGVALQIKQILLDRKDRVKKKQSEQSTGGCDRVIIIDDDPLIHNAVKAVAIKLGATDIRCCFDGMSALAELKTFDPNLVLVDLQMPGMDGIEVVRKYRATGAKAPIVMMTGDRTKETVVKAVKAGVSGYVVKPFTPKSLFEQLDGVLNPGKAA